MYNKNINIEWRYGGTEVYLNNEYVGYIILIGENDGWHGNVFSNEKGLSKSMKHFDICYDKKEIQTNIETYIQNNTENLISCFEIMNLFINE